MLSQQHPPSLPYQYASHHITTNVPLGEPVRQLPSCGRSFLHVDASKIGQLLQNVVSNAVRVPLSSAI